MDSIRDLILKSKAYHNLSNDLKKIYFSKYRISLYRFLQIFLSQMRKDHIVERASSMAFNFVLSLFPSVIFMFTLIPYVPVPDLEDKIMLSLHTLMPESIYEVVATTISNITHIPHGGLLSFGFLFALLTATNGTMAMIAAFNRCYKTAETRRFFKRVFIGMTIVIFLSLIVFISISFAALFKFYLNKLSFNKMFFYYLVLTFKYVLLFVVFFIATSLIYYIAPAVSVRWKFFSGGSLIAALLSVLFTLVFSFYVNSFESYNKLYGSIGAFIGVMLWFYAISVVLLIGFEINASFDLAKRERQKAIKKLL